MINLKNSIDVICLLCNRSSLRTFIKLKHILNERLDSKANKWIQLLVWYYSPFFFFQGKWMLINLFLIFIIFFLHFFSSSQIARENENIYIIVFEYLVLLFLKVNYFNRIKETIDLIIPYILLCKKNFLRF